MSAEFEIKRAKNGQYLFNLRAVNGEVILTSEMYETKSGATNGIDSVKMNAANDSRYDRRLAASGKPYFVLQAGNGEIIGKSEVYSSKSALEVGVRSVKKNGPDAHINDKTVSSTKSSEDNMSVSGAISTVSQAADMVEPAGEAAKAVVFESQA